VEGNSVRGTARLCDVEKRTVLNTLKLAGEACEHLLKERIRGVSTGGQVQCDEIFTFVQVKQRHLRPHHDPKVMGDAYTYICLDRTTVLAWHLGKRDRINTEDFISKVRWARAENEEFDICTDGFEAYAGAIDAGLHDRANHSQIVKVYSKPEEGRERYSPGDFVSVEKAAISGNPDMGRASTSHVERKNGSLRQWCKRLTRLTYAFSKKWGSLQAALALHFAYYNLCCPHGSLRITPAMEAGVADRIWELEDLING
jgi:IS1 family transposase